MQNGHRTEPREQVKLPLVLDGGAPTVTCDISASGLFFEADSEQRVGGVINFEIELETPGGPMKPWHKDRSCALSNKLAKPASG